MADASYDHGDSAAASIKVIAHRDSTFQLDPGDMKLGVNIWNFAEMLARWRPGVALGDWNTLEGVCSILLPERYLGIESEKKFQIGLLTVDGQVLTREGYLCSLLRAVAAGAVFVPVGDSAAVARYGAFMVYPNGSIAGPPDYLATKLAANILTATRAAGWEKYQTSMLEVGEDQALCQMLDWAWRMHVTEALQRLAEESGYRLRVTKSWLTAR